jgi:hypothetical protein
VGKLYAAPNNVDAVLIIDPLANTTDITTLAGLGSSGQKWIGITYAANVGKLYAAPSNAAAVLIIDPLTNTTDITTLANLGSGSGKWVGITYAANVGKLYAAPLNADAVLIIDPLANTTDITTLGGLGLGGSKSAGITYAANVGKMFAAPYNVAAVLVVNFGVDAAALLPFRLVADLTNTIISTQVAMSSMQVSQSSTESVLVSTQVSTQTAMSLIQEALLSAQISQSSTEAVLVSTQSSLVSTQVSTQAVLSSMQADLVATQAELSNVGETVCNQPVCAAGTQAVNGTCVPDCSDLRRRGVQCEPYCDAVNGVTPSDDAGTSSSWPLPIEVIGGLCAAVVVAIIGIAVYRRRSGRRGTVAMPTNQDAEMNLTAIVDRMPRHAQLGVSYETPITLNPAYAATGDAKFAKAADFEEPGPTYEDIDKVTVKLDGDLYVHGGSTDMYESVL